MSRTAFSIFFETQALIILSFCVMRTAMRFRKTMRRFLSFSDGVNLQRMGLVALLMSPWIVRSVQTETLWKAPVQIWASGAVASTAPTAKVVVLGMARDWMNPFTSQEFPSSWSWALVTLILAASFWRLRRALYDWNDLSEILETSVLVRQVGRLRIAASDRIATPISFLRFRKAYVVVPLSLFSSARLLKNSLLHELQHHRNSDTLWLYFEQFVGILFAINPWVHKLLRVFEETQELACDETLVGRGKISSQEYAHTLVEVAQKQREGCRQFVGTAGLSAHSTFLKGRIEMMFLKRSQTTKRFVRWVAAAGLCSVLGSLSYAAQGLVQDRRLSRERVDELVKLTNKNSQIAVVATPGLMKYLNKAVGTERGRLYVQATLRRMKEYRPMIEDQLKEHNLPLELLAVPAAESGFQNSDNTTAAGIWSFVPETARNFGLKVDEKTDERFDAQKLTGAAVGYYESLYSKFKDWHLALLSYNAGERTIEKAQSLSHAKDAFDLLAHATNLSSENRAYLDHVMTYMVILKNPKLLD